MWSSEIDYFKKEQKGTSYLYNIIFSRGTLSSIYALRLLIRERIELWEPRGRPAVWFIYLHLEGAHRHNTIKAEPIEFKIVTRTGKEDKTPAAPMINAGRNYVDSIYL